MKFTRKKNVSYYQKLLSRYNSVAAYASLFNCSGVPHYKSIIGIGVSNEVFLGESIKSVRQKKGKPLAQVRSDVNNQVRILFYKDIIGKFKVRQEYHFFEGELFSFVYNFPYAIDVDHQKIRTILLDKYLQDTNKNGSNMVINDDNNHFIKLQENLNIVVHYVDASSKMKKFVEARARRKQQAIKQFREKREFLIHNCL